MKSKLPVEVYGYTKAGRRAKRPFYYLTTADSEWISMLVSSEIRNPKDILIMSQNSSDIKELFKLMEEKGWTNKILENWSHVYVPLDVKRQLNNDLKVYKEQQRWWDSTLLS